MAQQYKSTDQELSMQINNCYNYYPQFKKDFKLLVKNDYIIKKDTCLKWTANRTSLAQYFYDFKYTCKEPVRGGFWAPIESLFNIKRGSLRSLVSTNGRGVTALKPSPDYIKIIELLSPRPESNKQKFLKIKEIINETDIKDSVKLRKSLEKIKKILFTKR